MTSQSTASSGEALICIFKQKLHKHFIKSFLGIALFLIASVPQISFGQSAFHFDGYDDFISYTPPYGPEAFGPDTEWTLEVIFELSSIKHNVLISQNDQIPTGSPFLLGIDASGNPYTEVFGNKYTVEESPLDTETCYHLSVVYGADLISFYLNGDHLQDFERLSNLPDITSTAEFVIGQLGSEPSTSFDGNMEELRIFTDVRNEQEISDYTFIALDFAQDNRLVCFDFLSLVDGATFGAYNNNQIGLLGSGESSFSPIWIEENCMEPLLIESVDPLCAAGTPTCSTAGLVPSELLCNGNFEQFCSALYLNHPGWGGSFPNWLLPHHAFAKFSIPSALAGSDVSNWSALSVTNTNGTPALTSPDMYVRNGIGSPVGFAPYLNANGSNAILNPPTTTWNGAGDGVVALSGSEQVPNVTTPMANEGIVTTLNSALQSNETYTFTGWFYKTRYFAQSGGSVSGIIELRFDNGSSTYSAGTISVPSWQNVSGNNNWYYGTLIFTTPANLPAGMNTLTIQNISSVGNLQYVFMDDLSLRGPSQEFPQYIYTGDNSDYHHRRIKVDANDNVYALVSIESVAGTEHVTIGDPALTALAGFTINNEESSMIVKYTRDGEYLWHKHFPHMILVDFDFDANGDIVAVGHTEKGTQWPNINYQGPNPSVLGTCSNGNVISYTANESTQLILVRASASNGNISFNIAKGGTGWEAAYGVHIDGSTAYILAENLLSSFCETSPGGPVLTANSGLPWPNAGNLITYSTVLRFDLSTNTEGNETAGYVANKPKMLKGAGSELFVLREDGNLDKVSILGTGTSAYSLINTAIASYPTYLQPSYDGTNLFVSYKDPEKVERRSFSNLSLISSFNVHKLPLSIASGPNGDYVLYRQDASNSSGKVLGIDKLDLSNFGVPIWSKESSHSASTPLNYYLTYRYDINSDIASYKMSTNEIAVIGSFETNASGWHINFGSKAIEGNQIGTSNCMLENLMDFGSSAVFKTNSNKPINADTPISFTDKSEKLSIYPNPTTGNVNLKYENTIYGAQVINLNGQIVKSVEFKASAPTVLDLSTLDEGLYFLRVQTKDGYLKSKILVK